MKTKKQKKDKENNIEEALELSIIDDKLKSLGKDFAELSIDNLLNDGIIKDIPIVGTVTNIYSGILNIKDKLFLKKVFSFLYKLKEIPVDERKKKMKKINDDKKYRIKIGEKLLYILDSCNDYESSERVGILFNKFLKGEINRKEFEKGSIILSKISNDDFDSFLEIGNLIERRRIKNILNETDNKKIQMIKISHLLAFGLFNIFNEEIEANIEEEDDWKTLVDGGSKYKAEIYGGITYAVLNDIGDLIMSIFNKGYRNRIQIEIDIKKYMEEKYKKYA